jgi:hypothetical protein
MEAIPVVTIPVTAALDERAVAGPLTRIAMSRATMSGAAAAPRRREQQVVAGERQWQGVR